MVHQIQGSVQTLVDHPNLRKLTNLPRWNDTRSYARLTYLQAMKKAVAEADENGGFRFPNMEEFLVLPDLELKDSVKQGTRKIIESMSKIFERSDGGSRRFSLRGSR